MTRWMRLVVRLYPRWWRHRLDVTAGWAIAA